MTQVIELKCTECGAPRLMSWAGLEAELCQQGDVI
jgi:hypothetical protein